MSVTPLSVANANPIWWSKLLGHESLTELQSALHQDPQWYACELNAGESALCLDDFFYYQQHFYGEALLGENQLNLSFIRGYDQHALNDLILNLRKDGLVLSRVEIQREHYDVAGALGTEGAVTSEVDKQLILFINRYPQEAARKLLWVKADALFAPSPRVRVELVSDGELIELRVSRR
ncbi:hypothetical protein [Vibrio sp. CAU 1672]|uniref:hypothetical protein n=1 Tax=Vibrio sp. CAU 1672 TaxID=3032594 RepID=UPI0023DAEEA4|nr:hypothetical protein [Vibrio sp. CAU 1672]